MPLVRESNGDAIVPERPQLLDQSIVQLAVPFAPKKRDDLLAPGDEFRPISPAALETVGAGHPLGVARIPAILGSPHLLDRRVERERRQRRSRLTVYVDQSRHGVVPPRLMTPPSPPTFRPLGVLRKRSYAGQCPRGV